MEYISQSSYECMRTLRNTDLYQSSSTIFCYLSMPQEIQTYAFIKDALGDGKDVYIPKVIGPNSTDMVVTLLESIDVIDQFPTSKWGIPEPPEEYMIRHPDVSKQPIFDIVIVPGVGFDRLGGRIGHGKGYYGKKDASCNLVNFFLKLK